MKHSKELNGFVSDASNFFKAYENAGYPTIKPDYAGAEKKQKEHKEKMDKLAQIVLNMKVR